MSGDVESDIARPSGISSDMEVGDLSVAVLRDPAGNTIGIWQPAG